MYTLTPTSQSTRSTFLNTPRGKPYHYGKGICGALALDEKINKQTKKMLDGMHRQKIDMSDAIFVINVNGYIGESTKNEIEYAKSKNKEIIYLEN